MFCLSYFIKITLTVLPIFYLFYICTLNAFTSVWKSIFVQDHTRNILQQCHLYPSSSPAHRHNSPQQSIKTVNRKQREVKGAVESRQRKSILNFISIRNFISGYSFHRRVNLRCDSNFLLSQVALKQKCSIVFGLVSHERLHGRMLRKSMLRESTQRV